MNRHDRIRDQLNWLESQGVIQGWEKSSPDRVRWSIWGTMLNLSLTTNEIELWISGAATAWTRCIRATPESPTL